LFALGPAVDFTSATCPRDDSVVDQNSSQESNVA